MPSDLESHRNGPGRTDKPVDAGVPNRSGGCVEREEWESSRVSRSASEQKMQNAAMVGSEGRSSAGNEGVVGGGREGGSFAFGGGQAQMTISPSSKGALFLGGGLQQDGKFRAREPPTPASLRATQTTHGPGQHQGELTTGSGPLAGQAGGRRGWGASDVDE